MRRVDGVLVVLAVQGSLFVQAIIMLACIDTLKNNSSARPAAIGRGSARGRPIRAQACNPALPATSERSDCAKRQLCRLGQELGAATGARSA